MKPAWDQLGEEYAASSSVLIGDVDCTVHQELCGKHGVRGYPTIKYYTGETGKEGASYSGGRDIDALKSFVSDTLEVKCLVADPTGCTDKENKYIAKFQAKSQDDVTAQIDRLTRMGEGKMRTSLRQWLNQRLNILKQLKE